jgi:hypothetical protein
MKATLSTVLAKWAWGFITTRAKCLLALAAVLSGLSSVQAAGNVQSPRGGETFGTLAVPAPSGKTVQLSWQFPAARQTPDLVFKVYQSTSLGLPLRLWSVLTNLPGTTRSVDIAADNAQAFFVVTASNFLGESGYATK